MVTKEKICTTRHQCSCERFTGKNLVTRALNKSSWPAPTNSQGHGKWQGTQSALLFSTSRSPPRFNGAETQQEK